MLLQPHPLLWTAIENTRMIRFAYHGKDRLAEPHDHGILNGSVQLLIWQVAGSSSRRLPNWLLTKVDAITDLVLLDQIFPGGARPPRANTLTGTCFSSGSSRPVGTCGLVHGKATLPPFALDCKPLDRI
jgi:hypothetical protein